MGDRHHDYRGIGDLSPETGLGRFVGAAVMVVGIGFIALLTGAVAERFLHEEIGDHRAAANELDALADLEQEIASEVVEIRRRLERLETLLTRR